MLNFTANLYLLKAASSIILQEQHTETVVVA
jgi:hypothetical protein